MWTARISQAWTTCGPGGHTTEPIRGRFEARFGLRVYATYGLTEVPTVVTIEPGRRGPRDRARADQVLPHLSVEGPATTTADVFPPAQRVR